MTVVNIYESVDETAVESAYLETGFSDRATTGQRRMKVLTGSLKSPMDS